MDKIKNRKVCFSQDEKLRQRPDINTDKTILPIDQSFGIDSNINPETGFPYSDIQLVMRANTLSERNRLMDNLQVSNSDFLDENITEQQAVDDLPNSRDQMPSEVIDYQQKELSSKINEHNAEVNENQRAELFEKFVNTIPTSDDNSKIE